MPFCRQTPLTLKALTAKDYSENPQTLGEHLKKRRRQLGLLQRETAAQMGVLTETYANWEKDKTKPVDPNSGLSWPSSAAIQHRRLRASRSAFRRGGGPWA